jgi:hypothetical protein
MAGGYYDDSTRIQQVENGYIVFSKSGTYVFPNLKMVFKHIEKELEGEDEK